MASLESLICPKCGGKLSPNNNICPYCNTAYVVKDGKALDLMDLHADDENLKTYLRRTRLASEHTLQQTHYVRVVSWEEIENLIHTARNDLKEEFQREPTMREVEARASVYIENKKQNYLAKENSKGFLTFLVVIVLGTLATAVVYWLMMSRW